MAEALGGHKDVEVRIRPDDPAPIRNRIVSRRRIIGYPGIDVAGVGLTRQTVNKCGGDFRRETVTERVPIEDKSSLRDNPLHEGLLSRQSIAALGDQDSAALRQQLHIFGRDPRLLRVESRQGGNRTARLDSNNHLDQRLRTGRIQECTDLWLDLWGGDWRGEVGGT